MGFLEVLTLVFIALKLMGTIDWSWLVVFSPMIFSFTIYLIFFVVFVVFSVKADKKSNSRLNRFGINRRE